MKITFESCGHCGASLKDGKFTRRIAIVDRDKDCVVAYRCPYCCAEEARSLGEVLAAADPAAFKERK
jgi:hypothetical protein